MRTASALLGLAVLALGVPAAAQPHPAAAAPKRAVPTLAPNDGRPLIVAAIAAGKHTSYVGQLSLIMSGTTQATAVVSKIEHRAPDETRRTYLAPRVLYGQYVISRGAVSWDVDPATKRVVVTENHAAADPVAAVDDVALLDANYRAERSGTDAIANRRVDVVDLVSKYTGERAMRLWIDDQTHVVLARESYHGDGSLAWRTRFDDIRYTDDIPPAIFDSTVPAGFSVTHGRTYAKPATVPNALPNPGFAPITPRYLPEGFALTGADLSESGGVHNLHLIYSDGIRTISLFENGAGRTTDFTGMHVQTTSFENHTASYVHEGPTTLLSWKEHGLGFVLIGDLELKQLVSIATSVVP
ncbi:MAG TPA: sigma-E factor regulatory protein RseB domain-containing protein [Candidatus Baltobacteraceae bacterium]|nr:sigma-E factor regulatory protein RseB domain-containing protein [Candidatus Baltobacteraceae bacterium]